MWVCEIERLGNKEVAALLGDVGEFGHRRKDVGLLLLEEALDLLVCLARILRPLRIEGDVDILEQSGVEFFVDAAVVGQDVVFAEVHEDEAAVHLDDAVLEAAVDAELVPLRLKADCRRVVLGDAPFSDWHLVEPAEGLQHSRADGRGAGKAHQARDVRAVFRREVAFGDLDAVFEAVFEEELRHGLQHADATVVAKEAQIVDQLFRRIEHRIVHLAWHEAHPGGLRERQVDTVVREGEGQRLAEIAVRRIAEQSRTGEASGFNGGHGEWEDKCLNG